MFKIKKSYLYLFFTLAYTVIFSSNTFAMKEIKKENNEKNEQTQEKITDKEKENNEKKNTNNNLPSQISQEEKEQNPGDTNNKNILERKLVNSNNTSLGDDNGDANNNDNRNGNGNAINPADNTWSAFITRLIIQSTIASFIGIVVNPGLINKFAKIFSKKYAAKSELKDFMRINENLKTQIAYLKANCKDKNIIKEVEKAYFESCKKLAYLQKNFIKKYA